MDTVVATISGMEGLDEADLESHNDVKAILVGATAFIKAGFGLSLSFIPTGKFVDVCEAVTGYEFCTFNGPKLDTVDRIFSGLGAVVGSGAFWRAAGMALGVGGTAAVILHQDGPVRRQPRRPGGGRAQGSHNPARAHAHPLRGSSRQGHTAASGFRRRDSFSSAGA